MGRVPSSFLCRLQLFSELNIRLSEFVFSSAIIFLHVFNFLNHFSIQGLFCLMGFFVVWAVAHVLANDYYLLLELQDFILKSNFILLEKTPLFFTLFLEADLHRLDQTCMLLLTLLLDLIFEVDHISDGLKSLDRICNGWIWIFALLLNCFNALQAKILAQQLDHSV